MSTKQKLVIICDLCHKEATSDPQEIYVGGSPFSGWLSVKKLAGDSVFPKPKRDFDFCSEDCLKKFKFE